MILIRHWGGTTLGDMKPCPTRTRLLARETRRLRRETALTLLFSATALWTSRLQLLRARRLVGAK